MTLNDNLKEKINSLLLKMHSGENCIGQTSDYILSLLDNNNSESKPKDLLIVRVPMQAEKEEFDNYKNGLESILNGIYTIIIISERFNERKETTFEIVKY